MTKIKDMHEKWLCDDGYRREYAALAEEFALLKGLVARRIEASAKVDVPAKFDHVDKPT